MFLFNIGDFLLACGCCLLAETYGYPGILVGLAARLSFVTWILTVMPRISLISGMACQKGNPKRIEQQGKAFWISVANMAKMIVVESVAIWVYSRGDWVANEPVHDTNVQTFSWYALQFIQFIPLSFAWEIVFDFFHYWTHRIAHMNKTLFMWIHYDHHEEDGDHLCPLSTFHQATLDYVATNFIPGLITFSLLSFAGWSITLFQLHLILAHKSGIEIGGHSGLSHSGTYTFTGFIQFPLLAAIPGVCISAEEHRLHHTRPTVNFSKRFRMWDEIFGTYDTFEGIKEKRFRRLLDIRIMLLGLRESVASGFEVNTLSKRRQTVLNPVGLEQFRLQEGNRNYKRGIRHSHKASSTNPILYNGTKAM